MNFVHKLVGALTLATALTVPALAQVTITAPGQSTTGTYMDYMKTVYDRATFAELLQVPIATFDKEFELTPMAAESWSQSEDGLTWTFKLRSGLVWSDGEPLTAEDYVFALQRAATSGYDFAWYWDFAGGIKGWKEVTEGTADVSTLGLKAVDDLTIEVTTTAPKPTCPPSPASGTPCPSTRSTSWRRLGPQRRHHRLFRPLRSRELGEVEQLRRPDQVRDLYRSLAGRGRPPRSRPDPGRSGSRPAGLPRRRRGLFLPQHRTGAGGQRPLPRWHPQECGLCHLLPVLRSRRCAVQRRQRPPRLLLCGGSQRADLYRPQGHRHPRRLDPPAGYPGYNPEIAAEAVFDPEKAKQFLADAGYPNGEGFPRSKSGCAKRAATTAPSSRPWPSTCRPSSRKCLASP